MSNNNLQHFGKLGMHWGVRNAASSSSGGGKPKGERLSGKAPKRNKQQQIGRHVIAGAALAGSAMLALSMKKDIDAFKVNRVIGKLAASTALVTYGGYLLGDDGNNA